MVAIMHGLHLYIQLDLFYFLYTVTTSKKRKEWDWGLWYNGAIVDILHFIVGAWLRGPVSLCTEEMVFWRTVSQERYLS